jgi:serine/threonine protein kinase
VTVETEKIGPWTLRDELGSGGNATVYRATRQGKRGSFALKVIRTTKAQKEPYRRFVREIEFLRDAGDEPGVLRLLDSYLPARPSRNDRAWLAMPVATPIRDALADSSLNEVVAAVAAIAKTMARLKDGHGLAHRDLKPGNLYELNGCWLVGDFGLVALPDVDEMTRQGRPVGPAHYTAYELILDPCSADPFPADVYSLGKTLWVLATSVSFPPEGHQSAATRGYLISDYRPHPHADALDLLVDRATRLNPKERPSMQQMAADLEAWSSLKTPAGSIDVSGLSKQLRTRLESRIAAEDLLEQRKELALAATRRLQELRRSLNDALRQVHPRAEIDVLADKPARNLLRTLRAFGGAEIVFGFDRVSRIAIGSSPRVYALTIGSSLELTEEGQLIFRAFAEVGWEHFGGADFLQQVTPRQAEVGSIEAERMLQEGIAELSAHLEAALAVFVENVPDGVS